MSDDEKSLDLVGIGKLAKTTPPESWNRIVKTACGTFSLLATPITASTEGTDRLIRAKFDHMVDIQKVLAADTLRRAKTAGIKTLATWPCRRGSRVPRRHKSTGHSKTTKHDPRWERIVCQRD